MLVPLDELWVSEYVSLCQTRIEGKGDFIFWVDIWDGFFCDIEIDLGVIRLLALHHIPVQVQLVFRVYHSTNVLINIWNCLTYDWHTEICFHNCIE